jgi:surfeit locus 1 family protein
MITLGFWQVHRANEKKQMLEAHLNSSKQPTQFWTPDLKMPEQYQKIKVEGQFLPFSLFLDNQYYQHQFGYDVITPFLIKTEEFGNEQILLVDRGWIKGDIDRNKLPKIPIDHKIKQIEGSVYYPSSKTWVLGEEGEKKSESIWIIERVDNKFIREILHKSVYPFIMRLGKREEGGFVRDWPIVSMPPQRHYAYALQWFSFAFVILVIFVALQARKVS